MSPLMTSLVMQESRQSPIHSPTVVGDTTGYQGLAGAFTPQAWPESRAFVGLETQSGKFQSLHIFPLNYDDVGTYLGGCN